MGTAARPRPDPAGGAAGGGRDAVKSCRRCWSTAECKAAPTSSPRSPWAPGPALVGRAYLYGLMAGGERGVQRAVDILTNEITRTMQLLGTDSVSRLEPAHVRLRP